MTKTNKDSKFISEAIIKKFEDDLLRAKNKRATSCYHNGNGDWVDNWELCRKFGFGYYEIPDQTKNYKSNVISPEISGRVQGALQKLSRMTTGYVLRPNNKMAKFSTEINQLIINQVQKKASIEYRFDDAYQDAIVLGTAPVSVDWAEEYRNVKMPVNNIDSMSEEETKEYKETGKIPYRKIKFYDFKGVKITNLRLEDVFVDPSASSINTGNKRAGFVYLVEGMTYDRFKTLYGNSDSFSNVDDVKPSNASDNLETEDSSDRYLSEPEDDDADYVEVVKRYGFDDDSFIIRANDVYIYNGPLPYADKLIPIEFMCGYKPNGQLYGIGIPNLLIPIVTQIELLTNAVYDYTIYTSNPWVAVQRGDYEKIASLLDESNGMPGTLFPVTQMNNVSPIKFPALSVDVFQALGQLQRDAVIASQQDPTQLGIMKKNATATANIINKEITEAYIMFVAQNMKEGKESIGRMILSRIHQFMRATEVQKKVKGEKGMDEELVESYQTVRIDDKKIDIDWDEKMVNVVDEPGAVSFVEMRPELYGYKDDSGNFVEFVPNDYDLEISSESMEITSRALEKQEAGEMLAQLSPYAVDVSNPMKVAQHPMPLINATKLMESVFEKKGWDKELLLQYANLEKDSISRAMAQNAEMFEGVRSMSHPGESSEHVNIHVTLAKVLEERFAVLVEDVTAIISSNTEVPPVLKYEFDKTKKAIELISEHILGDKEMPYSEPYTVAEKGKAMTQTPQPSMPQGMGDLGLQGLGGNAPAPEVGSPTQNAGYMGGPGEQIM